MKDALPVDLSAMRLFCGMARIGSLSITPRPPGHAKLSGQEKYRIRQGLYRIVYSIQDAELTVWIVKVGHRKDVYEKL